MQKVYSIQREGDEMVIRLSANNLKYIAETMPEVQYRVLDRDKFLDNFIRTLKERLGDRSEREELAIERLFYEAIDETYIDDDDECIIDENDPFNQDYNEDDE